MEDRGGGIGMTKKFNPYDPKYVMKRDNCSLEEAEKTIWLLKEKNAWNRGKKIKKANPYDPKYVMKRDNCSLEEAEKTIEQFKRSKATSKDNFVKRYGKVEGLKKYESWAEKTLRSGWELAKENGRAQSPRCKEFYMKRGLDESTSIEKAKEYQRENSPLHVEYYIKRGKSLEYAKKNIRKIHDKKKGIDSYAEYLKKTTEMTEVEIKEKIREVRGHNSKKKLTDEEFSARMKKLRKTMEDSGIWVPYESLTEYESYKREVWSHTNQNDLSELKNFYLRGKAGEDGAYHLDHKFSISRGFIEGIPPEIIGDKKNLEFIPWEENLSKQGKCTITIEELHNEN